MAAYTVGFISAVSKCCLAFYKGVCGRREQIGGWRSCERGIPFDPAVNETLPVPLSVLTGRLCHTIRWSCCLAPAVAIHFPEQHTELSVSKKNLFFLSASIQFGRYVCCTAGKSYSSCQTQTERERKNSNLFLYNQSLGKFDSVLNEKKKKKK